jgi:hypothetical protein
MDRGLVYEIAVHTPTHQQYCCVLLVRCLHSLPPSHTHVSHTALLFLIEFHFGLAVLLRLLPGAYDDAQLLSAANDSIRPSSFHQLLDASDHCICLSYRDPACIVAVPHATAC